MGDSRPWVRSQSYSSHQTVVCRSQDVYYKVLRYGAAVAGRLAEPSSVNSLTGCY